MPTKVLQTSPNPFRQEDIDSLRVLRESPFIHLRTVVVQFIQGLFWYLPKGSYHWEPNIGETEIVITDESPIRVKAYGGRPAISLTRAPVVFQTLGIDDVIGIDPITGTKTKGILVPGTLALNVCSRAALESETLAFMLAEHIWLLRDLLIKRSIYQIGQNIGIGAPSPAGSIVVADQGDEWTATTITLPFNLIRTGAVTSLGAKVLGAINTNTELRPPVGLYQGEQTTETSSTYTPGSAGSLARPDVQVELKPPGLRGRSIPLKGK